MTLASSSCDLQANDLGMMSAFYKYILTTMVSSAPASDTKTADQPGLGWGRGLTDGCSPGTWVD